MKTTHIVAYPDTHLDREIDEQTEPELPPLRDCPRCDEETESRYDFPESCEQCFIPYAYSDSEAVLCLMEDREIMSAEIEALRLKTRRLAGFNVRILHYKYLGPTNHLGSRVKIRDARFNRKLTIPFDHLFNNAGEVAVSYLLEAGWSVSGINEDAGIVILSDWDTEKQLGVTG